MVVKDSFPTAQAQPVEPATKSRWVEPADGWLAAGVFLRWTILLRPYGAIPLIPGLVKLRR